MAKADVWKDMVGWIDPREVSPPPKVQVAIVQEDLEVKWAIRHLEPFEHWITEEEGTLSPDRVLAWAWMEMVPELLRG
jgi:hypothetical protein